MGEKSLRTLLMCDNLLHHHTFISYHIDFLKVVDKVDVQSNCTVCDVSISTVIELASEIK